jgi:DNA-binding XRE family transcriptional regulator
MTPPRVDLDKLTERACFSAARVNDLDLTQGQLAELLDVGPWTVQAWEQGRTPIPRVVAAAVAYLLFTPRAAWPAPAPPRSAFAAKRTRKKAGGVIDPN